MKKFIRLSISLLIMMTTHTISEAAVNNVQIKYEVSFSEPQAHYADIEMTLSGLAQKAVDLKMPVWTPGSYLVREFAKNLEGFSAEAKGKPVEFVKTRKNIWHINIQGLSSIKVKYRIYAFEISVRTAFIDQTHAFLSTSGMFLYPDGMLKHPSTIHITPYKNWNKVSTSLEMVNNDPFTRTAPDYDILFDSPIEIGTQDVFDFKAAGVNYEVAMYGGGNYDKERLKKDMAHVIELETAVFGENPNKHYTFIVHNYNKAGGGLEHLSSTVLGMSRNSYNTEAGYQGFLSLVAHEHFHLWNVKRLRPIALGPFDYDNENYTTNLWIAEGFTAYYDNLIVHRTKLYSTENYLGILAADFNVVDNTPGTKMQPLAYASYDAWIKAYRPDENSINTGISYYNKGAVIASLLDLEIINDSNGKYSLDDVMRYMYNEYYKVRKRGYTDAEFKLALEKFAGKNLDDFYKKYINGVVPIDYNHYLNYAGYQVKDEFAGTENPTLGVKFPAAGNALKVAAVLRGSAAWVSGISVNDEIKAIDGQEVTDKKKLLDGKKVGDKVVVTVVRDGASLDIPVTLLRDTDVKYKIESVSSPSEKQLAVRKKWLSL
ncbi:PDZ domain-containing protein [Mucilaginibacter sp. RS28]|uniref:PDZ domain-containing protein n=1 Tax=Mucilaginibacter straminoryzae TaxID=2932774 RepID=A0A9X2B9Y3_9SPHI|nr:PDZ domain-containing protein [Mucilaginibacter straminoryzae]MCJ8208202.1 PDZ domain-containing protein [Mucilaginibacter straminoryzae]